MTNSLIVPAQGPEQHPRFERRDEIQRRDPVEIEKAWAAYQAALDAWRRSRHKVPANQP